MRKISLITICALICTAMSAQDMALISSRIINDPVNLATAGSSSASSANISMAAFGNAATMAFYEGKGDVQASFNRWAPDGQTSTRLSLGGGFRFGKVFSLAVAGVYGAGQEYQTVDDRGVPGGTVKPTDMMFSAALGIAASEHFGLGLNLKYADEKLYEDTSVKAIMVDASMMYHTGGLNVTAGVRNLGPKVHDQAERQYNIPTAANLAAYYALGIAEDHTLGFGIDGNYFFNGGISAAAGLQYSWKDMVFARAGYHYGTSSAPLPQYLGLGLGAKYYGVSLNVSYLTLNEALGNTIAVSLGYSF